MSDSFYGGKKGSSFILSKSFSSIAEMVENFKKGGSYNDVRYGDYVLINTTNKTDVDNGKLYRRGMEYSNSMGGAIYIGNISGPTGLFPQLNITSIDEVDKYKELTGYGSGVSSLTNGGLVSGKENSDIEWNYYNLEDSSGGQSTALIGIKIPYPVIEFEAETAQDSTDALATREDDSSNPFYQKWKFKFPKGANGDSVKNFRIVEASSSIEAYDGQEEDIENNREVLVYDYYESGKDPVTIYLGDFNTITDISVDEEGSFKINYSHDDAVTYENLFKWIQDVSLDNSTGKFRITYNQKNGDENVYYETTLKYVNNIVIDDDGSLELQFSDGSLSSLDTSFKWIDNITMSEDGSININYNNGETDSLENAITYIESITLEDNGDFTINYSNGLPALKTTLKWVSDFSIADNGTVTISYNTGESKEYSKIIKTISDISIQTADSTGVEGSGDQKVHITYNTGEISTIGSPLNYIVETAISPDYHYLVYYSDPDLRKRISAEGKSYAYDGKDDWLDLGAVKSDNGLLVGMNLDSSKYPSLTTTEKVINYLNTSYSDGLDGGKLVSFGSEDSGKQLYAFDYSLENGTYKGWYYIGGFSSSGVSGVVMVASESDSNITTLKSNLSTGGVWFILED